MSASEERTEEATPRRRAKSHTQGVHAQSALAGSALALAGGLLTSQILMRQFDAWRSAFRDAAAAAPVIMRGHEGASSLSFASWVLQGTGLLEVAASASGCAVVAAVAATLACGSLGFAPPAIVPTAARILSRAGFRRLFDGENLNQTAGACLALVIVTWMLVPLLLDNVVLMAHLTDVIAQAGVAVHASAVLWWRAIIGVALIGVVDVVVQRRKHAVRLKMSPREVRDERAQAEGRPESKQRRRALGLRRARNLRVDAIRRATVVITNPTHVAVALRYAPPLIDVPTVVARGADLMAPFVRAVARLFAVPVIEAPELARSLYLHVDIDEPIPEECYAAVAAIFTWIVRTRGALRRGDEEDM